MPTIEKGIRRHSAGHLEANITIHGRKYWKSFPKHVTLEQVRNWRMLKEMAEGDPGPAICTALAELERKLKTKAQQPERWQVPSTVAPVVGSSSPIHVGGLTIQPAGTLFRDDIATYLPLKGTLVTLDQRKYHLGLWAEKFGHLDRNTVSELMVRSALADFQKRGNADLELKRLSNGSLNKLLTAIMDFYTVLNGKNGYNPTKGLARLSEKSTTPWVLPSHEDAVKAIDAVCHPKYPKADATKTQIRLRLMLFTGWPQAIIMQIRPADIRWSASEVMLHGREKGSKTPPRLVPVTADALVVLRQFDKLDCYGEFDTSSMHSTLQTACENAGVKFFNPYMLRHKFITDCARSGMGLQTVMRLALHTNIQQTLAYCQNADQELMAAGLKQLKHA